MIRMECCTEQQKLSEENGFHWPFCSNIMFLISYVCYEFDEHHSFNKNMRSELLSFYNDDITKAIMLIINQ